MRTDGRLPGLPLGPGDDPAPERDPGARPGAEEEERFAALLRGSSPAAAMLAGLSTGPPQETGLAARLVETVAERLLVSDEGKGGQGAAVRVLAKDVGIPGLEVAVRREADGRLVVELLADHPADLALLRGGAAELVGRLEARFGARAEVRVLRRGAEQRPSPEGTE